MCLRVLCKALHCQWSASPSSTRPLRSSTFSTLRSLKPVHDLTQRTLQACTCCSDPRAPRAKSVEICSYSAKLNILKGALRRRLRVPCEARHSKACARPYAANSAGVEMFQFALPQVCSALSSSVRRCSYAYDIRKTIAILRDNLP